MACQRLALVGLANNLVLRPELGTGLNTHSLAILPLGTLLVEVCVFLVCFSVARALVGQLEERQEATTQSRA